MKRVLFIVIIFALRSTFSFAQSWQPVGTAIQDTGGNSILSLAVFDGELYAGGYIYGRCPTNNIAKWNGIKWDSVGSGVSDTGVYSMVAYDSLLFAVGKFHVAGGIPANSVAQWNGTKWDSTGAISSVIGNFINTVCVYNKEIYIGGSYEMTINGKRFNYMSRWNGSQWDSVGAGVNGDVWALAVYNGELYVAGDFSIAGNINSNIIARWDGTKWDSVGGGLSGGNDEAFALNVYKGKLYVGGWFTKAGGINVNDIASWDGTKWDSVGSGVSGNYIYTLAPYNGNLYAGGLFTDAGGKPANNIAKWNGANWSAVGAGFNEQYIGVTSLAVYDSSLYAGGDFTKSGTTTCMGVASWRDSVILGVNEAKAKSEEVKVYPNPSKGLFNISINNYDGNTHFVEVYNVLGEKVYSAELYSPTSQIDLSDKPSGIYLYRAINETGSLVASGKLIIQ